jgi:hypothetical protein
LYLFVRAFQSLAVNKFQPVAMAPSDFAYANVEDVLNELTTEEAILLTAGVGFWHTHEVRRLGVPAIKARMFLVIGWHISTSPRSAMAPMALVETIS